MVGYEKAKVHGKLAIEIGKGVAINKNGLGVEFDLEKLQGLIR